MDGLYWYSHTGKVLDGILQSKASATPQSMALMIQLGRITFRTPESGMPPQMVKNEQNKFYMEKFRNTISLISTDNPRCTT